MKIVYIAPYSPWGPDFGGRMRVRMIWQILSERHDTELMVVGDEPSAAAELSARAAEFFPAATETPAGRARRIARAMLTGRSIPAARYLWPKRERLITAKVRAARPDVVVLGDTYLAELCAPLRSRVPGVRIIADTMNVESELHAGVAAAAGSALVRFAYRALASNTEALERRALKLADQVWAASEENARSYRQRFGLGNVAVVLNAVPRREPAGDGDADIVLFVGTFAYLPNAQAAECLLQVSQELAQSGVKHRLWLVGRSPDAALQKAVAAVPHAEMFADVPEVQSYIKRCAVFAAPFLSGSGTKLKIAEALMSGKAVVTTPHGAEGLAMTPGLEFVLADPEHFVPALAALLADPTLRRRIGIAGREWALQNLTYDRVSRDMETALANL
ncbi:MAG TPA: glycosyltransferase family 4 protein [Candidatus Limnocylindrales bacterium]|nr:glycosyltransferase family 4 protein [Candidatus Limnocylindrales bacterium]